MPNLFKRIFNRFRERCKVLAQIPGPVRLRPVYRVHSIYQDEDGSYFTLIQVINKNITLKMQPEEILANDSLTDQFSPRDIRTLTYLGYLGINSPKYSILAQRLSGQDNRFIFAIKDKQDDTMHIKTAAEISADQEVLNQLHQRDAHLVGFVSATEALLQEKQQKQTLIKQFNQLDEIDNKDKETT